MKQTMENMQVTYDDPIMILSNNTSAIHISNNPVMHYKKKRIPIKYHFLREHVVEKNIKMEYIGIKEQILDIFTNPPQERYFIIIDKDWD